MSGQIASKILLTLIGLCYALSLPFVRAEDNVTNLINGITVDGGGTNYFVGKTGTNNFLKISGGGVLTNVSQGIIGSNITAAANSALVTGAGSFWFCNSNLIVGSASVSNAFVIADGGAFTSYSTGPLIIGNLATAQNNSLLITGAGSALTNNGNAIVGQTTGATGNSLIISNGGTYVTAVSAFIGNGSYNNSVQVIGAGSAWNVKGATFSVGNNATSGSNSLTVADGGAVTAATTVYISNNGGNDSVFVTGTGSTFTHGANLIMGQSATATNNSLVISNGGVFNSGGSVYIGNVAKANNNSALVTDTGSIWNCNGSGVFIVGNQGTSGSLTISNGGVLNSLNGSSLIIGNGGSSNSVLITGQDSAWNAPYSSLWLGAQGAAPNYNNLTIANGGSFSVYDIALSNATCRLNFNQGTLQAGGPTPNFISGIGSVYIQSGGAIIDVQSFDVAITNALLADSTSSGGGLTVIGTVGTLTLGGANTYTGNTTVNGATLVVQQPVLSASSTITVTNGGLLQLDFANSETNQVATLILNGITQPAGIYNSTTSPDYLSGAGSLQVGAVAPSYPTNLSYSVSGQVLTLAWPASHLGWYIQSNSVGLAASNQWYDIPNSELATNLVIQINPSQPNMFYRMRLP